VEEGQGALVSQSRDALRAGTLYNRTRCPKGPLVVVTATTKYTKVYICSRHTATRIVVTLLTEAPAGWSRFQPAPLSPPAHPCLRPRQLRQPATHLVGTKDFGECLWQDASQLQVGVCDGQVAPLLVAHGAGVGSA
jgi:hypothetical protein